MTEFWYHFALLQNGNREAWTYLLVKFRNSFVSALSGKADDTGKVRHGYLPRALFCAFPAR
jgi:hypothetical protein